jgi:hypothetical protein
MRKSMRLPDTYRFPGFWPRAIVRGIFGDPLARIVTLRRRRKKRSVAFAGSPNEASMIESFVASVTFPAATRGCSWKSRFDVWTVLGVAP